MQRDKKLSSQQSKPALVGPEVGNRRSLVQKHGTRFLSKVLSQWSVGGEPNIRAGAIVFIIQRCELIVELVVDEHVHRRWRQRGSSSLPNDAPDLI